MQENVPQELVQYMRGDVPRSGDGGNDAMDDYLHVFYSDIEDPYKERIYKLLS